MSTTQCYSCKKYCHIAPHCLEKFCNYCKQFGHIIKECPTHPSCSNKAYHAVVTFGALQPVVSAVTTTTTPPLTRELVQEMMHAFSALGLQGTGSLSTSWIVDSGASNHMPDSSHGLSNIREYCGTSCIQTANVSDLAIIAVGDASSSFKDVFVSPILSVNLVSVGQLVDQNCDAHFSHDGCVVQDQMSGQLIV